MNALDMSAAATTVWADWALLQDGWARSVRVDIASDGRIAGVEAGVDAVGYKVDVLLPAPANVHSHAFQRAMAGLTEGRGPDPTDSFWTWRRLMFRFLQRLTPEHLEAISAFVQMEMAEAGYAANVEFHYLHHQVDGHPYDFLAETGARVAQATRLSGIGLTLLPVHYRYGGCDRRPLGPGQIRFGTDPDAFAALFEASRSALAGLPDDTRLGVAPHSLRACAPETIPAIAALAGDGPVHMHLAEQVAEVEEVVAGFGMRPTEWVLDAMALDARHCFIHCTQMLPHETAGLARSGAVAGLCPVTEANLGDGIFDGLRFFDAGGHIALGSDSNIRISLAEEIRMLDYSQRLRDRSRAALSTPDRTTGRRIYEMAAAGGALASGRDAGTIATGKLADLLALDGAHPSMIGRTGDALIDSFAFAGDSSLVRDVWSAGRHIVRQGAHPNRQRIVSAYGAVLRDLAGVL